MREIRVRRMLLGLRMWDLSRRANVTMSRLSLIERGLLEASAEERQRLARVIGDPEDVLFREMRLDSSAGAKSENTPIGVT